MFTKSLFVHLLLPNQLAFGIKNFDAKELGFILKELPVLLRKAQQDHAFLTLYGQRIGRRQPWSLP